MPCNFDFESIGIESDGAYLLISYSLKMRRDGAIKYMEQVDSIL